MARKDSEDETSGKKKKIVKVKEKPDRIKEVKKEKEESLEEVEELKDFEKDFVSEAAIVEETPIEVVESEREVGGLIGEETEDGEEAPGSFVDLSADYGAAGRRPEDEEGQTNISYGGRSESRESSFSGYSANTGQGSGGDFYSSGDSRDGGIYSGQADGGGMYSDGSESDGPKFINDASDLEEKTQETSMGGFGIVKGGSREDSMGGLGIAKKADSRKGGNDNKYDGMSL